MGTTHKCTMCKWAALIDNGYSNYTVEGTDFVCSKGKHPSGVFDSWYGEDVRFDYAQSCGEFAEGDPVRMDVECEDEPSLTDDQRAIYAAALAVLKC